MLAGAAGSARAVKDALEPWSAEVDAAASSGRRVRDVVLASPGQQLKFTPLRN